ncbi:hypothetical protein EUTSA_v10011800mg [Eutrema salsugineum]|uniref:Signal recognition particle 19 kDa protein n=2 Tax=Eutrema salsugineum TaxID=72664 RepID=V4KHT4_EUTSA|nr:hypothetical protein EUTSA_v10011800mg [Eutrema salsugineum]
MYKFIFRGNKKFSYLPSCACIRFGVSMLVNYLEIETDLCNLHGFNRMDSGALNIKKWVVMYPVYINSKKTVAEGRRISLSKACENPNCIEISDCCKHLKLPSAVEIDKAYPRDFMQVGRVRVQLKREDGTLLNPAITSRKQLMQKIAELVPRHPERVKKQESQKAKKQEPQATTSTSGTSSKSGKGGKKKR